MASSGGRSTSSTCDDGYNPANTVQLTRQLVEQTKVFAIVGSLGTEPNLAIRPYLNAAKVPQMLVATGATTWGRDWKKFPWTTGWQPDYELEGKIYGQSIAHNAGNQKIAVLYQNDDYGNDYLRGLKAGLGAKVGNIADAEAYDVTATDVKSQVAKLRATGASVFCIFATPKFTIQSYVIAHALGWNPPVIYMNSVSGTATFLLDAPRRRVQATWSTTPSRSSTPRIRQPSLGERQRDEAVQAGAVPVRAAAETRGRAQLLRRRRRRGVRRAAAESRAEPHPPVVDRRLSQLGPGEPVPDPGQQGNTPTRRSSSRFGAR